MNCRSGDYLAQEQVTATGKENVLKALGEASTKIAGETGRITEDGAETGYAD